MNTLRVLKKDNYSIVQINRGKVNAVNIEMVKELTTTFQSLKDDDDIKGVIITGQPHFLQQG